MCNPLQEFLTKHKEQEPVAVGSTESTVAPCCSMLLQVEIWCWQRTCHHGYQLLADDPHLPLKLYYLDGFRDRITMRRAARPGVADMEDADIVRPNEAEEAQDAAVQAWGHDSMSPLKW